jgi:radical SAM superfamily enzyme YgiQ (UPF0313 family)
MRVLLVYANRYRRMAPPPIGLAYLTGPLRHDGHEVEVLDLMFSRDPEGELRRRIIAFRPDVAGFSIRNVDNQDMGHNEYFIEEARRLVAIAREMGVTTVLGGTAFTTFPVEMLKYMGADYGIAGQGERSLPALLRSLKEGKLDRSISGLTWRENGSIMANPPDLSGYHSARAEWDGIRLNGYAGGFFPGAAITKTGCPYRCAYCDVEEAFGDRFSYRRPEDIVDEIKALKETHGIRAFTLTDACFNVPIEYAREVLKAIIRADLKVYLNTNIVPVAGQYDDGLIGLYKKAGGICASLGAEAFSGKMLKAYNKPFTLDDVLDCASMLDRHGLPFMVQALFGGPGEDSSTIKEAMDTLRHVHFSSFAYTIGIRLLPGTALYEAAMKEGLVKDRSELFRPKFYVSKSLDVEWAKGYIKKRMLPYSYRRLKMLPLMARLALARAGMAPACRK